MLQGLFLKTKTLSPVSPVKLLKSMDLIYNHLYDHQYSIKVAYLVQISQIVLLVNAVYSRRKNCYFSGLESNSE